MTFWLHFFFPDGFIKNFFAATNPLCRYVLQVYLCPGRLSETEADLSLTRRLCADGRARTPQKPAGSDSGSDDGAGGAEADRPRRTTGQWDGTLPGVYSLILTACRPAMLWFCHAAVLKHGCPGILFYHYAPGFFRAVVVW